MLNSPEPASPFLVNPNILHIAHHSKLWYLSSPDLDCGAPGGAPMLEPPIADPAEFIAIPIPVFAACFAIPIPVFVELVTACFAIPIPIPIPAFVVLAAACFAIPIPIPMPPCVLHMFPPPDEPGGDARLRPPGDPGGGGRESDDDDCCNPGRCVLRDRLFIDAPMLPNADEACCPIVPEAQGFDAVGDVVEVDQFTDDP